MNMVQYRSFINSLYTVIANTNVEPEIFKNSIYYVLCINKCARWIGMYTEQAAYRADRYRIHDMHGAIFPFEYICFRE